MSRVSVLFVCARNAGLSIMAEAYLNHLGLPGFRAFSAGVEPADTVHPRALETLAGAGLSTERLEPKPLELFAFDLAPEPDVVVALGPKVLGVAEPAWRSPPRRLAWLIEDPLGKGGRRAFAEAYDAVRRRVDHALAGARFAPAGGLMVPA
ncbi:Protein-tyrosine-phosphatase [Pseudoxanthobacter soli DSM 19599]|uniref:Protein-tyrosine-phosphatase n=1 Tax=Pseudoxanthobacter soli DSM 19599 TaxID=1123029 RepID=A0A1M7ZC07_9HYPH|nr:hypothetical protein [Pseudoxanthobacter soli]SHO62382.1 Protein-tyrosine-phosphatase [Pseudoxanthobacter soli DSM 19599]